MPDETLACCGEKLHWVIAHAREGKCRWQLLRCRICEHTYRTGSSPTGSRTAAEICTALVRALDKAVVEAYTVRR